MQTDRYLTNGRYTRSMPRAFAHSFSRFQIQPHSALTVRAVIDAVRKYFSYGGYVTSTHDLRLSRFISVTKILKLRLRTCGSLAAVTAAVFRSLEYPTRLVDGRLNQGKKTLRHAWLEVYLERPRGWYAIDPSRGSGRITTAYHRRRTYQDWAELEQEKARLS